MAPLPDVLRAAPTVIVVFAGLLAVTGFFQPRSCAGCGALRAPRRRRRARSGAPDSTEMAGEIVATDISTPGSRWPTDCTQMDTVSHGLRMSSRPS